MRECNGGPHAVAWCGKPATVVCTERESSCPPDVAALLGPGAHPLEWFACDDVEHHEGAATTPIAQWFARAQGGDR